MEEPHKDFPLQTAPLPEWGTRPLSIILSVWRVTLAVWWRVLLFVCIDLLWGIPFLLGAFSSTITMYDTFIIQFSSFLLAFLIQTRLNFAINRYQQTILHFVYACNGMEQLSQLLLGLVGRVGKAKAPNTVDKRTEALSFGGRRRNMDTGGVTLLTVVEELSEFIAVFPVALLCRYTNKDGWVDFVSLGLPQELNEEASFSTEEPLQGLLAAITRRMGVLMETEAFAGSYCNAFWRTLQNTTDRMAGISSARRSPVPQAYRDFLVFLIDLFLLVLPVFAWPRYSWYSAIVEAVMAFVLIGLVEVADSIKEPFAHLDQQLFTSVDLTKVAYRAERVIRLSCHMLLKDLRAYSDVDEIKSMPTLTPSELTPRRESHTLFVVRGDAAVPVVPVPDTKA